MQTTTDLIKKFYPNKSISTIAAYSADLDYFTLYLNLDSAQDALDLLFSLPENQANLLVLHYKSELLRSGQSIPSINRKLTTIRTLVNAAMTLGLVAWKLDINNEKPKISRPVNCLSKDELKSLLKAARSQPNKIKAARDIAIIRLMYDLALKRSIIVNLQLSQFNAQKKYLEIVTTSLEQTTQKMLPIKTLNAINQWLKFRGTDEGALFDNLDVAKKKRNGISSTSIYRIVRELGKSIGLEITPEEIRKSAIKEVVSQAKDLGISDQEILAFTDHKSTASLKKFKYNKTKIQHSLSNLLAKN